MIFRALGVALALLGGGCLLDNEHQKPEPDPDPDPCAGQTRSSCPQPGLRAYVFVSAEPYASNLATIGESEDGLTGADNLCTLRARVAGLGGEWKAWLSTSTVDAIDRITGEGPWYLVGGDRIAFNSRDNLRTEPLTSLTIDEWGDSLSGELWTATRHGGGRSTSDPSKTCSDWTGASPSSGQGYSLTGIVGMIDARWTEAYATACYERHHLLCIEQ